MSEPELFSEEERRSTEHSLRAPEDKPGEHDAQRGKVQPTDAQAGAVLEQKEGSLVSDLAAVRSYLECNTSVFPSVSRSVRNLTRRVIDELSKENQRLKQELAIAKNVRHPVQVPLAKDQPEEPKETPEVQPELEKADLGKQASNKRPIVQQAVDLILDINKQDLSESPDLACLFTSMLPQEAVKYVHEKGPKVYEKQALWKYLADKAQEGGEIRDPHSQSLIVEDDPTNAYVNAKSEVYSWIEQNVHRTQAQEWMLTQLNRGRTPRQRGEMLMKLIRRTFPREEQLQYGEDKASVINSDLGRRLEFAPIARVPKDKEEAVIDVVRKLPEVLWVQECHDLRGPDFGSIFAVGVRNVAQIRVVNEIKAQWKASGLSCMPLTIFEPALDPPTPNRTAKARDFGRTWWREHNRSVEQLFDGHSHLVSAFVDAATGKTNDCGVALVCVVANKGFVPVHEQEIPCVFEGLQTDVRSGQGGWCSGAHPDAFNTEDFSCYVGQSLGSEDKRLTTAGTLGAIVLKDGKKLGLTAAHVVLQPDKTYYAPAYCDFRVCGSATHAAFSVVDMAHFAHGPVGFDAALISLAANPTTYGRVTGTNLIARTALHGEKVYHQTGNPCVVPPEDCYLFGRTSGCLGLSLVCSEVAHLKALALPAIILEEEKDQIVIEKTPGLEPRELFRNQLLFQTEKGENRGGDSGSCVWEVVGEKDLNCVGLMWYQLKDPTADASRYLAATPIQAVLTHFGCSLAQYDAAEEFVEEEDAC